MRETILFLYIGGESDCELQLKQRIDIQDLTQNEMYWATVTPDAVFFIYLFWTEIPILTPTR